MREFVISSQLLRPLSLFVHPSSAERCDVSTESGSWLMRNGAIAAGVAVLLLSLFILAAGAGKMDSGVKGLFLGIVVLCWGLGRPLTYSVDLRRNGTARSLMTTDDYEFGRCVANLCNELLTNPDSTQAYRVDPKAKWIKVEPVTP